MEEVGLDVEKTVEDEGGGEGTEDVDVAYGGSDDNGIETSVGEASDGPDGGFE